MWGFAVIIFFLNLLFLGGGVLFRAAPVACGSSQAWGRI